MPDRSLVLAALAAASLLGTTSCRSSQEVVVFHAASLRRVLSDAAERFQQQNPGVVVRLEPSGSQVAARKLTELGLRADVVAVADVGILEKMLVPRYASAAVEFATNELVLAHKDHSRFTDEISDKNWPEVLQRPGVRLGRVDPDLAPLGYHTVFAWQLAERAGLGAGLADALAARVPPESVAQDETELLALLESRSIDYAFLYRSTAEDHHLKITALPDSYNLSRRDFGAAYAQARLGVELKRGDPKATLTGAPIVYGFALTSAAPNPALARRFAAFLVGEEGRRILTRGGFHPLSPALSRGSGSLPPELAAAVSPSP